MWQLKTTSFYDTKKKRMEMEVPVEKNKMFGFGNSGSESFDFNENGTIYVQLVQYVCRKLMPTGLILLSTPHTT
jgi:hypothetical protein